MNLPLLKSNLNSPKIIWHQTDVVVVLQIQLCDIEKYYLRIDRERLNFSTCLNDKKYYVIINMYGAIIPEKCMHRNTGREIKVYIPKAHIGAEWLRLHLEKEKNPHIVSDPDRVTVPEWRRPLPRNFNADSFEKYKRLNKIKNVRPDEPSSGEEDSDDEIFDTYFD
ncbi:uncharacterized protein LOC117179758 [Belonocnema kinseyi]|uniref:uncharacterized protein LOC117179758 n=1 Tax=Belonocnema kinseyi TaxID=2817044 RepID=UPI00143DAC2B|nr:uncharacterized protein LOC117179758 [Belonocnema kinseyi]XP_033227727.1 uncharacterized protein LOC117179758 [Belonocnema kinseyi]